MKLVSYRTSQAFSGEPGREANLGILAEDRVVPAAAAVARYPTVSDYLDDWPTSQGALSRAWDEASGELAGTAVGLAEVELLAPVPRPGKIVAIGVNYVSHAIEQDREAPDHPVLFAKLPSAVVGPGAEVRWDPGLTNAVDLEAELAVVIGRRCRRVATSEALEFVAGYTCLNDVTARDLQYSDKQFVRAKSLDTFCPMGPALVTPDEMPEPQALRIGSFVNGDRMQDASTADMIFGVAELVSFCSRAFTLEPGDVIATGTPAGVGWFRQPKRLLKDGDQIAVEIQGIGRLVNTCREERG